MALIEYRIKVDSSGKATVTQHVLEIGRGDRIQYCRDDGEAHFPGKLKQTVIRIEGPSPCKDLPSGKNLKIPKVGASPKAHAVTRSNTGEPKRARNCDGVAQQRRFFDIRCGFQPGDDPLGFTKWEGQGPGTPDPGSRRSLRN